jgi:hypothetical protein
LRLSEIELYSHDIIIFIIICLFIYLRYRISASGAQRIIMYTYGAPRVGNKAFAAAFNDRLGGAAWRVTNISDIVPTVPRLMGYAHVKTGVRLTGGGGLMFEEQPKDLLGEGREVLDALQVRGCNVRGCKGNRMG